MGDEKLLTIRDAAAILSITEKEVIDLAESGQLPAYKVGGVYLRFKREQVHDYKKIIQVPAAKGAQVNAADKYLPQNKVSDFFYFNDFYILAGLIILLILYVIFRGY